MQKELQEESQKRMRARLLRKYGFGVPDLMRAVNSADDALTLIVQEESLPFTERGTLGPLHIHRLPWPEQSLRDLGATIVRLRVTLSYFIEPNPGERGWRGRYQYASHGLRFDVKGSTESLVQFRKRLNDMAREEGETPHGSGDTGNWFLGPQARHRGSLHADLWTGTAADLAERSVVAVYPVSGWWKEKKDFRGKRKTRYALVVSIETPGTEVDIYTPVLQQVSIQIET